MNFNYLTFSDGAKFALIARNLVNGNGFTTDFSFWGETLFTTNGIPVLVPYLMSIFFKIFGSTDFAVILFSFFFYLSLTVSVFLLGRKLFSTLVGVMSGLAVAFNYDFLNYARSGASEPLFAFELVMATYFLTFKKVWLNVLGFLMMLLMYFTRPQAFIFIAGLILFFLLINLGVKKGFICFLGFGVLGILIDKFIIYPLSFKFSFLNPIIIRGIESILTYSSQSPVSNALRGAASSTLGMVEIFKKLFYNIYNFYKLMPDIVNPYLFVLFVISFATKGRREFKLFSLFIFSMTFLVTALTIPFYRYIHPIVPIVYITAIGTLYGIISNKIAFSILVLFLSVGQTLGAVFLDSRFEKNIFNINKPPVYVLLSQKLKEDTKETDLIITNLDTWGSWYGQRKTVWFPLDPKMIEDKNFDAIYLTSYKIDDENYYMNESWRKIFSDPQKQTLLPEYKFAKEYRIGVDDNYEKEDARGVLLIKK